uniref:Putative capsid protein n=1 Tax=viral metagenome TaxID=1070528 RepID=A0A6M3KGM6_9ZZZZ
MATQTLLTPTMIAKEALRLLKNNMVMGNLVYRNYENEFPGTPKKGGSVQIRKPVKFRVAKTRVRSTKTITEQYITLNCTTQAHVSWNFFTVDLTLTIEEYSERYIRPACAALANQVDADLCGLYVNVPNQVYESSGWTVTPHTFMVLGKAMQRMDEEAVPPDERVVVFNPAAHWSFANALSNWNFKEGGEQALRKGFLGRIANAEIFMDQNIKVHKTGYWSTATDTAAATTGRLLIHSTADSGAAGGLPSGIGADVSQNQNILVMGFALSSQTPLLAGDTFQIAGCYAVNPMSGQSTGVLRQFVVTSDVAVVTSDCTANPASVYFYPDMINTGPYQTVDTIPQLGAKLWVDGDPWCQYPQNLAFHKNAFALVIVPLVKPDGQWGATETENGVSIRVVKDYDIDVDSEIIRLDILYGVKTIYPELAVRIMGAESAFI